MKKQKKQKFPEIIYTTFDYDGDDAYPISWEELPIDQEDDAAVGEYKLIRSGKLKRPKASVEWS